MTDDAQGEVLEVAWSAELDARRLDGDGWGGLALSGTDDPATFAAYLRTLEWNTATATDRDLFQAPFRAGIRLDPYQLLPLRKALRLPRVNLLIADDVGLGKTVEAGLVLREMLLRRRLDFVLVSAPAGMIPQWQDELEAKFGLAFTVVDRDHLAELRRARGFSANPWAAGSRFLLSHSLLADEGYVAGLRDVLGEFRPRALLILDEAHHAAPATGRRYAVDSQFTRALDDLAGRFEHRLFLSATPHNGHSNSFSRLLEMLDPQRFTRGVPVRPKDLEPVMVRRLKSDLRRFGEAFPERVIEPIVLDGLPDAAPELVLPRMLADYDTLRAGRIARLPAREAAQAKLVFVGLQQRLLSSIAAFAHTLGVHRATLLRQAEAASDAAASAAPAIAAVRAFAAGALGLEDGDDDPTEDDLAAEEDAAARAATAAGALGATAAHLRTELAHVDTMLALAQAHKDAPDARVAWLVRWIRRTMAPGGTWNSRRLVLFTEWEATRFWLQAQLRRALSDLEPESRVAAYTGATSQDRRETLKRAFNADPDREPLRILICTDAAREGINLQSRCHDLIHVDLPWNPARLEQRNGRIDRKLQPSPKVWCRYFMLAQRPEDIVLDALVRKTEEIRKELGSAGQVVAARLAERLAQGGIVDASALAASVRGESAGAESATAADELDDAEAARLRRQEREVDDLKRLLERSEERVGVPPAELERVVATALVRSHVSLDAARSDEVGGTALFRLDPSDPAFTGASWADAFDDLRSPRRGRRQALREWRREAPVRRLAFRPAIRPDGTDADDVVQLHLEHRLVRRLLSRFLSQGFQSGLERVCVVASGGAQPRVVLLGRLALYGPSAARLHEEIIPVTALWTEAGRGASAPLRPLAERGEETTLARLKDALRDPRRPPPAVERARAWAGRDARDLEPELRRRAEARQAEAERALARRGEEEAEALRRLLLDQRARIEDEAAKKDDLQLLLPGLGDAEAAREAEQRRLDRRHWSARLARLDGEAETEPARVRDGYATRAARIEPVGLLYLWPVP